MRCSPVPRRASLDKLAQQQREIYRYTNSRLDWATLIPSAWWITPAAGGGGGAAVSSCRDPRDRKFEVLQRPTQKLNKQHTAGRRLVTSAHTDQATMPEVEQESKRDAEDKQRKQSAQEEKDGGGGGGGGSGSGRGAGAEATNAPVHESKRIPVVHPNKRATRASTGAPIALTAKGSLYKANKDTGERHMETEMYDGQLVVVVVALCIEGCGGVF